MFFKKLLSTLTVSTLLLSAFGCTPTQSPDTTMAPSTETIQPTVSTEPQKEASMLLELTPDTPTEIDLDADGNMETVVYTLTEATEEWDDDYSSMELTVTAQDGTSVTHVTEHGFYSLQTFAVKLDKSSNAMTLVYSNNFGSGDYETVFLKYENSKLEKIQCAPLYPDDDYEEVFSLYAYFKDINEDYSFTVETVSDVLGTRWGYCEYELKDGMIQRTEDGDWFSDKQYFPLTTVKELPVTFIENETETEGSLPVGSKIFITRVSVDYTKAYFTTEDNLTEGFIEVVVNGYPTMINGLEESEYFDEIPYAG